MTVQSKFIDATGRIMHSIPITVYESSKDYADVALIIGIVLAVITYFTRSHNAGKKIAGLRNIALAIPLVGYCVMLLPTHSFQMLYIAEQGIGIFTILALGFAVFYSAIDQKFEKWWVIITPFIGAFRLACAVVVITGIIAIIS